MRLSSLRAAGAAALLLLAAPAALAAQEPAATPGTVLSINPLALIFTGISGEIEHRTGPSTALALGLSIWAIDDFDYQSVEGKFRFYPNGQALRGFSVAGTVGYSHVSEDDELIGEEGNAITAGVELNYQWLLGAQRNFAITLGAGGKRLFFVGDGIEDASVGIPTIRFSIGYAF
jgi:hypothetical protein